MTLSEPTLAPPGAGLPTPEAWIARRVIFPLGRWRSTWARSDRAFAIEGERVLTLFDSVPAERQVERILIRRLPGLEDSSRYWSAAMTVEHLVIVGQAIRRTMDALREGDRDVPAARIEDVKPRGLMSTGEVRTAFVELLAVNAADRRPPTTRHGGPTADHPWFGPLNTFSWHYMLGLHQQIHRRQLQAIVGEHLRLMTGK